jgi:hypothetical protein
LSFSTKAWVGRARVAEAVLLLVAARMLILFVPLHLWRSSLGEMGSQSSEADAIAWPRIRAVVRAVNRAAERLPVELACLPRAMAAQWMLKRRGIPACLVIGVSQSETTAAGQRLHAWVEAGGRAVMGAPSQHVYRSGLVLHAPAAAPKI